MYNEKLEQLITLAHKVHKLQQVSKVSLTETFPNDVDSIRALFVEYYQIEEIVRNKHEKKDIGKAATGVISAVLDGATGGIGGTVLSMASNLFGSEDKEKRIEADIYTIKTQFINQFSIPTSKEGFHEFLSNAIPLALPTKDADEAITQLWKNKCNTVIDKAKFLLKNDTDALFDVMYYDSKLKKSNKNKIIRYIGIGILSAVVLVAGGWYFSYSNNKDEQGAAPEKARLELILDKTNAAINAQQYDEAEILANQLVWKYESDWSNHTEEKEAWYKERKEILKIIRKRNNTEGTWDKIKNVFD